MPSLKIICTVKKLIGSKDDSDKEIAAELYWNSCSLKMKKKLLIYYHENRELNLPEVDGSYRNFIDFQTSNVNNERQFENLVEKKVSEKIKSLINKQTQL